MRKQRIAFITGAVVLMLTAGLVVRAEQATAMGGDSEREIQK